MTTRTQARDELLGLVSTAMTGEDQVTIIWDNKDGDKPGAQNSWMRVTLRHREGAQSSLGAEDRRRRFRNDGMLIVQVFCPTGPGLSESDRLSMKLLEQFRSRRTASGVLLRKAKASEIGPDGGWHQTNVSVEFEYDEIV